MKPAKLDRQSTYPAQSTYDATSTVEPRWRRPRPSRYFALLVPASSNKLPLSTSSELSGDLTSPGAIQSIMPSGKTLPRPAYDPANPLIVQSDRTVLVEVDNPRYAE